MREREIKIESDFLKTEVKQLQSQVQQKATEITTLKSQKEDIYSAEIKNLMTEHREALQEQQEHFDHLLANLRSQAEATKEQLNSEKLDLTSQLRERDAKIEELQWLTSKEREAHKEEGQAMTMEIFQEMSSLHRKYIQEIGTLNK